MRTDRRSLSTSTPSQSKITSDGATGDRSRRMQTRSAGSSPSSDSRVRTERSPSPSSPSVSTLKPSRSYSGRFHGTSANVVRVSADTPWSWPQIAALVDQRPAETVTLVLGVHAELLDVHGVVDPVDDHVADRLVVLVDRDPPATVRGDALQLGGRGGLVLRDLRHADLAEPGPRGSLDGADGLDVAGGQRSDGGAHASDAEAGSHQGGDVVVAAEQLDLCRGLAAVDEQRELADGPAHGDPGNRTVGHHRRVRPSCAG